MGFLGERYHERARFYDRLATALDSGLPPGQSLALIAGRDDRMSTASATIATAVAGGGSLADGMAGAGFQTFERLSVEAGERSGRLPGVLGRLSRYFTARGQAADRIGTGLVYPLVLLHGAVLLPPLFLLVRDGVASYLAAIFPLLFILYGGGAALWLVYRMLATDATRKARVDRFVHSLPLLGEAARCLALADFADVFATLYATGIPIPEALEAAAQANRNSLFRAAGQRAADAVRKGAGIYAALEGEQDVFGRIYLDSVRVAEAAGKLEETLDTSARIARQDAERTMDRLAAGVPIAAYVLAGLLVAYVVVRFWFGLVGG